VSTERFRVHWATRGVGIMEPAGVVSCVKVERVTRRIIGASLQTKIESVHRSSLLFTAKQMSVGVDG